VTSPNSRKQSVKRAALSSQQISLKNRGHSATLVAKVRQQSWWLGVQIPTGKPPLLVLSEDSKLLWWLRLLPELSTPKKKPLRRINLS